MGAANPTVVWQAAIDFFGQLGDAAAAAGTVIVMEANPAEYGTDFVNRTAQAIDLVRAVDNPGFRLQLDCGCMTLAGDPLSLIGEGMPLARHFHISEPGLGIIGSGAVDHATFARELRTHGYNRWVSIEMREGQPFSLDTLSGAISFALSAYST
jgi:sugar phosphate isomerase/epimerase